MTRQFKEIIRKFIVSGSSVNAESNLALFNEGTLRRSLYFYKLLQIVDNVDGSIIECGVGEGKTLAVLCSLVALQNRDRVIWAFDSFEGFPELQTEDEADENFKKALNEYKKFDVRYVYRTLQEFGISRSDIDRRIAFAKGFIPESLSLYDDKPIALLHLDLDIYASYKAAVTFFWDKMAAGGIVAFDEYNKPLDIAKWPGASKAINEFLDSNGLRSKLMKDSCTGGVYIVKES